MALRPADLAVVVVYLAGITWFGVRFQKGQRTLSDYFLGGRHLPWWALALSVVSAETSILTIISTPGIAYASNFNFLQLVFGYVVGRIVVAIVLIPRYFSGDLFTAYQFIEHRFGPRLKLFTAGLFLFTRALAEGVRVFAISIVLSVVFQTGVPVAAAVVIVLTLLYTFKGGLAAVIWTDVIQLSIYIAGTLVALAIAVHDVPGGWARVHEIGLMAGNKFQVFNFRLTFHQPYVFWSGLVGGAFLTSASHGTDQLIVQRLLAAVNKRRSQLALVTSGFVILGQFSLFLLVGAAMFAYYKVYPPSQPFGRGDQVFPSFVVHHLPMGLAGLLTAAILAAGMANLSAALNALASSSVIDIYRPYFAPQIDERRLLAVSRRLTLVWGAILVVIAMGAAQLHQSVLELALTVASVPYGSMLGIFMLGALTRRTTPGGAFAGALAGLAALGAVIGLTGIAWTWYVPIGATVTFVVGWTASRPAALQPVGAGSGNP